MEEKFCQVSCFHASPPGSFLLLKSSNLSLASKIVLSETCSEIFNKFRIPNTFARYAKEFTESESMKHWSRIYNFSYINISYHKSLKTHHFITSMLLCEAEWCVQTQLSAQFFEHRGFDDVAQIKFKACTIASNTSYKYRGRMSFPHHVLTNAVISDHIFLMRVVNPELFANMVKSLSAQNASTRSHNKQWESKNSFIIVMSLPSLFLSEVYKREIMLSFHSDAHVKTKLEVWHNLRHWLSHPTESQFLPHFPLFAPPVWLQIYPAYHVFDLITNSIIW